MSCTMLPPPTPTDALPDDRIAAPRSAWGRGLLLSGLVLAVALFYALGGNRYLSWESIIAHRAILRALVQEHFPLALAILFGVYVAVAGLSLPVTPVLSIAAGIFFGLWPGLVVVSFASTTGATLAFLNSRYLFRDLVQRHFGARLAVINQGVETSGPYYLMTLRLMPVVPFSLVNLGMGLTRMPVWTFWWVSQLAMLPVAFVFLNAGAELGELTSPSDILTLPRVTALALLSVVPLLLSLAVRRRRPAIAMEDENQS